MATGLHKRPVMGQTSIRSEGSAKCSIHRNKELVFVCSDCNELICTTCCVSGHRNHTLEEIAAVNSRQRNKLVDFINDTEENKLPGLQKELESIEQKVVETTHNFGTVLPEQIQKRGTLCKTDIDRYISQLNSSVHEKKRKNIDLLQAYKNNIQKRYDHLSLMTKECKQILQSGTSVLVFDKVKVVECLKTEPFSMPFLLTPTYKAGTGISEHMEQAIGTLETCTTKYKAGTDNSQHMEQAPRKLCSCLGVVTRTWKKQSAFVKALVIVSLVFLLVFVACVTRAVLAIFVGLNCSKMSTLVLKPDGSVLFHDKKSNTILHLDDSNVRNSEYLFNILDISLSPKTDTLWVSTEMNGIFLLNLPSLLEREWIRSDTPVFCLHVTKNGNLVAGGLGLIIYTKEGTVRHEANDTSYLYMIPVRIVECPITGNLAVVRVHVLIPWMSDIAVYDKTLTLLFNYDLPEASWSQVVSIAYDSFGNIVIGESRTKTVYLISGTGQYIKNLFAVKGELRSIAIQTPCNILWAAVQQDIPMNRTEVKITQRLLDLPNPSNECKRLRQNVLKTVQIITKDKETQCDLPQDLILFFKELVLEVFFKKCK